MKCNAIAAAALLAFTSHLAAVDWPHWRGPLRNGHSAETGWFKAWPAEGPKILWRASVGVGFSCFSVADGRVYTMGSDGKQDGAHDTVWCLDEATGKVLWKHEYESALDPYLYEGGPNSTPTIAGGRVYTVGRSGHVFALDAATGKVVWQRHLVDELKLKKPDWGFSSSPVVEDGRVYLNAGSHGVALDAATGKDVWVSGTNPSAYATPVFIGEGAERVLVFLSHRELVGVDPGSGEKRWSVPWKSGYDTSAPDVMAEGNRFVVSSYDQPATLFTLTKGQPQRGWKNSEVLVHLSPGVVVNGALFAFASRADRGGGTFKCLDFSTGELKWTAENLGAGGLVVADGKLLILSGAGELIVAEANPSAFKPLARAQVIGGRCWTPPVLSNGRVYVRNSKGDVVCLQM